MERITGEKRNLAFKKLAEALKKNPEVTHSQLPAGLHFSYATFRRWKIKILAGKVTKHKSSIDYEPIKVFLEKNPEASYREFIKQTSIKISDAAYYLFRRKLQDGTNNNKRTYNRNLLYYKICSFFPSDSDGYNDKAKELLAMFIAKLKETGRANFEVVELSNPKEIEIRELVKR